MDLNADLGEGFATDRELLGLITSASVACGGHAGDAATMRITAELAGARGVALGAHPGYPDRDSFGRNEIGASAADIERWTREQVEAFAEVCGLLGASLRYVKAHGALYNRAWRDDEAAAALAAAVKAVDPRLVVLGPPDSAMLSAADSAGLRTTREAFLDRGYAADGTLVPRGEPDALVTDAAAAAERALDIAHGKDVRSTDGMCLAIRAESVCVHGDSPHAVAIARAARERLLGAGIELAPFV
jgi:UPF0271 protein